MTPTPYPELGGDVLGQFLEDTCGMFENQNIITGQAIAFLGVVINWDGSETAQKVVAAHLSGAGKQNFAKAAL